MAVVMPFALQDEDFFDRITKLYVEYDRPAGEFVLVCHVMGQIPDRWLKALDIILVHDEKPLQIACRPEWRDTGDSQIAARLKFDARDDQRKRHFRYDSDNYLPIKEVTLKRGESRRTFPNHYRRSRPNQA